MTLKMGKNQVKLCVCACAQLLSRVWLCVPLDCGLPGSSVIGIYQARILERVAIFSSRGSSWPRDWTHNSCVCCIAGRFFTGWAIVEALELTWGLKKKKKMVRTEKLQLSTCRLSKQWVNSQDWSHIRMADNCLLGTEIRKVLKNTSSVLFFWLFKKLKYLFSCTGSQLSHVGSSVATWKFLVAACRI